MRYLIEPEYSISATPMTTSAIASILLVMKLLAGSSVPHLATSIADHLGIEQVSVELDSFANHETRVHIDATLRGENVVLVQSFSHTPDEHIMETLLITDALERMGVRHVNLVVPWMGYSLQDKVFRPGEPIAAKVVANMLSNSYLKRIFLLDLHNSSTPGFFSVPSHHLSANALFENYVREHVALEDAIVASPDFGGLKRARVFADQLALDLVNIDKHRDLNTGAVTAVGLHGEVTDKHVLFYDDVIMSGSTVEEGAALVKEQGARRVSFLATHGMLVGDAHARLATAAVDDIVITNSIHHEKATIADEQRITVLDAGPLFADELQIWL